METHLGWQQSICLYKTVYNNFDDEIENWNYTVTKHL